MAVGGPRVLGVVLAGGRSTRFGSEKAVAVVDGAPMVARVAAVLARGCEAVAVNAPEASGAAAWARAHGLTVLPDPPGLPDGPLAGVLSGLEAAEALGCEWLATAPCDTPWLPRDMIPRLLAARSGAPASAAVTRGSSHPLCAVWSTTLRSRLEAELAQGQHPSVHGWLLQAGAVEVRFPRERAFANVNRRSWLFGDWRAPALIVFGLLGWPLVTTMLVGALQRPLGGVRSATYGAVFYGAWFIGFAATVIYAGVLCARLAGRILRSRSPHRAFPLRRRGGI